MGTVVVAVAAPSVAVTEYPLPLPTFGNVPGTGSVVVPTAENPFGPVSVSVAPGSGCDELSVTDTFTAPAVTPSVTASAGSSRP